MEKRYTIEQDGNNITVRKNTDIEELISLCQYLLNEKKVKELNLCAIQNAIEILDKACIELMNHNPELYRLNKLTNSQTKSNKNDKNELGLNISFKEYIEKQNKINDENFKETIKEHDYLKLEVKLFLGKPGKRDKFDEPKIARTHEEKMEELNRGFEKFDEPKIERSLKMDELMRRKMESGKYDEPKIERSLKMEELMRRKMEFEIFDELSAFKNDGYKENFTEEEKQKLDKIYEENKKVNDLIIQRKNNDSYINNKNELKIILNPEKQPINKLEKESI